MQTRDHKLLGEYLLHKSGRELSSLAKIAFMIGNVEPDRNPFTYLHGMLKGKKFHGHNYENILPIMRKIYTSLKNHKYLGILNYYHLGKLIHYTADTFTYPHNEIYKNGLRAHRRYESRLHEKFLMAMQEGMSRNGDVPRLEKFEELEDIHREYLRNVGDYFWDCRYILKASAMVVQSCLNEIAAPIPLKKMNEIIYIG